VFIVKLLLIFYGIHQKQLKKIKKAFQFDGKLFIGQQQFAIN